DVEYCKQILRTITVTYRPLRLQELVTTAGLSEPPFDNIKSITELVNMCASFLTVHAETVRFIHQSAKDFITTGKGQGIFSYNTAEEHRQIVSRSLRAM